MVIGLGDMGRQTTERRRTQWNRIVGNAWRHCRVGHGMPFRPMGRGFPYLKQFSEREGIAEFLQNYKTDDGYRLGAVGAIQRTNKDTMNLDRRQRLEALPGWSWDVLSEQWEEGFSYLKQFSEREGHCRVVLATRRRWLWARDMGLQFKERKRTQWNLIVGNAWRHCRVGHGIHIPINGRRVFSSETVFRTRGALPSAQRLQDRRWLSAWSVGCSSENNEGHNGPDASATIRGTAGLVMGCTGHTCGRKASPSETVFRPREVTAE